MRIVLCPLESRVCWIIETKLSEREREQETESDTELRDLNEYEYAIW